MATVELAVAIPSLLVVLVLALSALALGVDQLRCVDAARAGARLLARGEPAGVAAREAHAVAPAGASVRTSASGTGVSVSVVGRAPRALAWLGSSAVPRSTAHARSEPALGERALGERARGERALGERALGEPAPRA